METHSSILAWEIPWTVEPSLTDGYSPGVTKNQTQLTMYTGTVYVGRMTIDKCSNHQLHSLLMSAM